MRKLAMVFAVLAALLAGCSHGPPPPTEATTKPAASPTRSGGPVVVNTGEPTSACGTSAWSTVPADSNFIAVAQLADVRTGSHDCYDRVVFDLNGPDDAGYHVAYVDTVTSEAKGDAVPVAGDAVLQVTIRAWSFAHSPQYASRQPWHVQDRLSGKVGPSVLEVKFAGEQEGQCTFAVGVSGKRKFMVSNWRQGSVMHVIVDIAH